MRFIVNHFRIIMSMKSDAGKMPCIRIINVKDSNARRRSLESGGPWFVEWSE